MGGTNEEERLSRQNDVRVEDGKEKGINTVCVQPADVCE